MMSKKLEKDPEIEIGRNSYTTRPFVVKRDSELAFINEVVMFRIVLPVLDDNDPEQLILRHELLIQRENIQEKQFSVVNEGEFQIRRVRKGLCDYFMIMTGRDYFGTIECMFHSLILNFGFAPSKEIQNEGSPSQKPEDFQSFFKKTTKNCKFCFNRYSCE